MACVLPNSYQLPALAKDAGPGHWHTQRSHTTDICTSAPEVAGTRGEARTQDWVNVDSRPHISRMWAMLRVLPLIAAAFAAVVIGTCVALARKHDHVPHWMHYPPISMGGYKDPERTVYAVGFTVVGLLFSLMAPSMRRLVRASNRPSTRRAADVGTVLAFAAFAGLCMQAIVPLQPDILDVLGGQAPLSAQSLIHQLGAIVFFVASLLHGFVVVWVLDNDDTLLCSRAQQPRAWWCKVVCLCALVVPAIIAFTFHPAGMKAEHATMNVRGPALAAVPRGRALTRATPLPERRPRTVGRCGVPHRLLRLLQRRLPRHSPRHQAHPPRVAAL